MLVIIFIISVELNGQDPLSINYNTSNRLPSQEVYDIQEDDKGILWFTTDRGVARYDGQSFQTFTTSDGLECITNFQIFQLPDNSLGFLGYDGSISFYRNGHFFAFHGNENLFKVLEGNWISKIQCIDDICLAASSRLKNSIFELNLKTGEVIKTPVIHQSLPSKKPKIKSFGEYDQVLLVDKLGVVRSSIQSDSFTLYHIGEKLYDQNLNSVFGDDIKVHYIAQLKSLNWICTNNGLYLMDQTGNNLIHKKYFQNLIVTNIGLDFDGNYWITTLKNGIFFITTFDVPLIDINTKTEKKEKVNFLSQKSDTLYAYSMDDGLFVVDKNQTASKVDNQDIRYVDEIGPYNISIRIDQTLEGNKFQYLIEDQTFVQRKIGGFSVSRKENGSVHRKLTELGENLTSVEPGKDGYWIGGMNSLFYCDKDWNNARKVAEYEQINSRISDLLYTQNGLLWISTLGKGLICIMNDTVYSYNQQDGLNSNIIHKVKMENDTVLWLATNNGFQEVTVRMKNEKPILFAKNTYGLVDGLSSNFITDMILRKDDIVLATDNGINIIQRDKLNKQYAIPTAAIIAVESLKNNELIANNAKLDHDNNSVSISYIAIAYTKDPTQRFYRYKLVKNGNPSTWRYTDESKISFASLESGTYDFTVQARNRNGKWSDSAKAYQFSIAPHWSNSWQFILACILFSGMLIYLFVKSRYNRLKQKNKLADINNRINQVELNSLRNQMNPHFVFNQLNSIQSYIFERDIEKANFYLTKFARFIRSGLEYSSLPEISLEEEIRFINNYMSLEKMRYSNAFDFELIIAKDIAMNSIMIPPLICQPILENSIKHGLNKVDYKGLITLRIDQDSNQQTLLITIADNGEEINSLQKKNYQGTLKTSKGIAIVKQRLQLLNEQNKVSINTIVHGKQKLKNGYITKIVLEYSKNITSL